MTKRLLKLLCLSSFRSIWVSAKMHLDEKETYKIPKLKKISFALVIFQSYLLHLDWRQFANSARRYGW